MNLESQKCLPKVSILFSLVFMFAGCRQDGIKQDLSTELHFRRSAY